MVCNLILRQYLIFLECIHIKTSMGKIVHIRKCYFCYNNFNFFFFLDPPSYIILISLILLQPEGTIRISMESNVHFDEFCLTAVT